MAAELVVPDKADLKSRVQDVLGDLRTVLSDRVLSLEEALEDDAYRLGLGMQTLLRLVQAQFENARKKLSLLSPLVALERGRQRMADLARQIHVRLLHSFELKQADFNKAVEKLSGLSPLNILARGYSITFKMPEGSIVKSVQALKAGDRIKTKVHRGEIVSHIAEVRDHGRD